MARVRTVDAAEGARDARRSPPREAPHGRACRGGPAWLAPGRAPIDLRQLRYFVRIVDLGSMSRAAGALHIAQSALSQHVATLEAELKAELLHRTPRGVQPTEAGRQLYLHAQLILQHAADAKAAVASASAEPVGHVALGLPLSLVPGLGLPIFEAVRRRHPAIRLQVLEELSGTILEWVKNGRLTLGIAFDDGHLEGLQTVPLIEERLFLVAAAGSPLARRKVLPLRELAGLELVLPTRGQGVRERIDRALTEAGLGVANVVAEIDSFTLMKQAAGAGVAPTVLSWMSVQAEVARGDLVAVEITRPAITRTAHVCMLAAQARSRAAECVRGELVAAVRDQVQRPAWRGVRFVGAA